MIGNSIHHTERDRHEAARLRDALLAEMSSGDIDIVLRRLDAEYEDEGASRSIAGMLRVDRHRKALLAVKNARLAKGE